MLKITIPGSEFFNDETQEFIYTKDTVLTLEHSLLSLTKWEGKWQIPFMSTTDKTSEQTFDYIRCMVVSPKEFDPQIVYGLSNSQVEEIIAYIESPMTATTFRETNQPPSREIVTAELIYYWMIALNIPFECQKWHLNRLLALIRVCNIKNQPEKKMSSNEIYARNRALNEARKRQHNTRG